MAERAGHVHQLLIIGGGNDFWIHVRPVVHVIAFLVRFDETRKPAMLGGRLPVEALRDHDDFGILWRKIEADVVVQLAMRAPVDGGDSCVGARIHVAGERIAALDVHVVAGLRAVVRDMDLVAHLAGI